MVSPGDHTHVFSIIISKFFYLPNTCTKEKLKSHKTKYILIVGKEKRYFTILCKHF